MASHDRMQLLHKRQRAVASAVGEALSTNVRESTTRRGAAAVSTTRRVTSAAASTTRARASTTERAAAASVASTTASTTAAAAVTTSAQPVANSASARSSSAVSRAVPASSSSSRASNTAGAANSNLAASSGPNGAAIGGGIAAAVLVLAAIVGFFVWRKKKATNLARGSGSTLIGGNSGGMNTVGYKKHSDSDDEFGNSPNSFNQDEKNFSAGNYGGGWAPPIPQVMQQPQQQSRASWDAPTYATNSPNGVYPPASTTNLLHDQIEQKEMQQHLDNQRELNGGAMNGLPVLAAAAVPNSNTSESNPFMESEGQGNIYLVKRTFEPSLDDELVLLPGDRVQMSVKYDDGWALGVNLDSGNPPNKGVFPFDCLGELVSKGNPNQPQEAGPLATIPEAEDSLNSPMPDSPIVAITPASPQRRDSRGDHPKTFMNYDQTQQTAPQLPNLRSDSPLSGDWNQSNAAQNHSSAANRAASPVMPSISISDPNSGATTNYFEGTPTSAEFPSTLQPGHRDSLPVAAANNGKAKRTSSLIASRDADLFVALGEVMDKEKH